MMFVRNCGAKLQASAQLRTGCFKL